jgi:hypothetical protein
MRVFNVILACLLAACAVETIPDTDLDRRDDAVSMSIVLEGDALAAELAASPVREAPAPFARLGLLWDAPAAARLEISTSADGVSFDDWQEARIHHVEREAGESAVAELELVDAAARYYRLRAAGAVAPTFLEVEFIEHRRGGAAETGESPSSDDHLDSTTQPLTVGGAQVASRAIWGARPATCASSHAPEQITIHHTATPTIDTLSPEARLRQIQAYHMDVNGWCDIAYHFLVSRDGRLWEGRVASRVGAHVSNHNTGNAGISFIGTHTEIAPTAAQIAAAARLVRGLADRYGIPLVADRLSGHRDFGTGTECPGDRLHASLGAILARARGGGAGPAQGGTGALVGVVYRGDDTDARIAGASVALDTGHTAVTDADGYYELSGLAAGDVTITATKPGFAARSIARTITAGTTTWGSLGL